MGLPGRAREKIYSKGNRERKQNREKMKKLETQITFLKKYHRIIINY